MAEFQFKDRADFQKMVDALIEETLTLDYKASPALSRDSKNVDELCKDVSAMANSAGGQLIYGIEEDKKTHKPKAVDDGVTDERITREWLHQILSSRIQPRIDGIAIDRILLSVMRRATTPDLHVVLSFPTGNKYTVQFASRQEVRINAACHACRDPKSLQLICGPKLFFTEKPIFISAGLSLRAAGPATKRIDPLPATGMDGTRPNDKGLCASGREDPCSDRRISLGMSFERLRTAKLISDINKPHDSYRQKSDPLLPIFSDPYMTDVKFNVGGVVLREVGADRKSVLFSRRFKKVGCSRGAEGEQQAISTFRYWRKTGLNALWITRPILTHNGLPRTERRCATCAISGHGPG